MLPMLLVVKSGRWKLWIPLLVLWVPLFFILLLLSPLLLIAALVMSIGGVRPLLAARIFWNILCALRGTHIEVETPEEQVLISVR